jgi:predicted nucleotidyltransferase
VCADVDIFAERRQFSDERIGALRRNLAEMAELAELPGLSIYATGSYARREASGFSDLDLFLVAHGEEPISHIDEILLDAKLIGLTRKLDFPPFSGDAKYLEVHAFTEMKARLGTPQDDVLNLFTARILLLLESVPLCHEEAYDAILRGIVETYFRDFESHDSDFRPLFLLNDVLRFWRTVCLNYESTRAPSIHGDAKYKARVKNLKLKFSRSFTCFSTIMHLVKEKGGIAPETILEVVDLPPSERVLTAAEDTRGGGELANDILKEYAWFLDFTGRPSADVVEAMRDGEQHSEAMRRAEAFGQALYRLVSALARDAGIERYLVI